MADLIDRQAAIDALIRKMRPHNNGDGTMTICIMTEGLVRETLNTLPSAQRTGRWIFETLDGAPGYRPTVMFCSKCGRVSIADYSYCPHCGARMEEQDEYTD